MRRTWLSQQWVALEVPCKSARKVGSRSGVGLATGEWRAALVRGIHHLPLGIRLVCAVARCLLFCYGLLDPHKAWRRDLMSWSSAASALKPSSQPSLGSVEAGPWRRAPTERQQRSVRMRCRRRSILENKKHHWAWFYGTCHEGYPGCCRTQHTAGSHGWLLLKWEGCGWH